MESSAWSRSPGWLVGAPALVVSVVALLVALSQDAGGAGGARDARAIGKTKVVSNHRTAPPDVAFFGAQARCPRGWVATAGGFQADGPVSGGGPQIIQSVRKAGSPRVWFVEVAIPDGVVRRDFAAQAICAKQKGG